MALFLSPFRKEFPPQGTDIFQFKDYFQPSCSDRILIQQIQIDSELVFSIYANVKRSDPRLFENSWHNVVSITTT